MARNINGQYRFMIEGGSDPSGYYRLYPINSTIEWVFTKDEDFKLTRQNLNTKLICAKNDFDLLWQMLNGDRCSERRVVVQIDCGGTGDWENYWEGLFIPSEAYWDKDNCNVEFNLKALDKYSCWLDRKKTVQVFGFGDEVKMFYDGGWYQYKLCERVGLIPSLLNKTIEQIREKQSGILDLGDDLLTNQPELFITDCFPNMTGWTPVKSYMDVILDGHGRNTATGTLGTVWVRVAFPNLGFPPYHTSEWTVDGNLLVRPVEKLYPWKYLGETNTIISESTSRARFTYTRGVEGQLFMPQEFIGNLDNPSHFHIDPLRYRIDNGWKLNDFITGILDIICGGFTVRSEFLGINPLGNRPDNSAYTKMEYILNKGNLVFWQMSDVARPYVSENSNPLAFANRYKVKDVFKDLVTLFNLGFDYDKDNDVLIIEHVSYFETNKRVVDLTGDFLFSFLHGKHRFKFDKSNVAVREVFRWPSETSPEWEMGYFYEGSCVDYDFEQKVISTDYIFTDLGKIHEEIFETSTDGSKTNPYKSSTMIFLALVDSNQLLVWDDVWHRPNGLLSYPSLEVLHRYGRQLPAGDLELANTPPQSVVFETWEYNRVQDDFGVPMTCEDIQTFNPATDRFKTQMGEGRIKEAKIACPQNVLTLKLAHA